MRTSTCPWTQQGGSVATAVITLVEHTNWGSALCKEGAKVEKWMHRIQPQSCVEGDGVRAISPWKALMEKLIVTEKTERLGDRVWGCLCEVFGSQENGQSARLGLMFTVHCRRWRDVLWSERSLYVCTWPFLAVTLNYSGLQLYSETTRKLLYVMQNVIHGGRRELCVSVCVRARLLFI